MAFIYSNDTAGGITWAAWVELIEWLADDAAAAGMVLDNPSGTSLVLTQTTTTTLSLSAGQALVAGSLGTLTSAMTFTVPDNTTGSTRNDAVSIQWNATTGALTLGYRMGTSTSAYAPAAGEYVLWGSATPSHTAGSAAVAPTLTDKRTYMPRRVHVARSPGSRPTSPRTGDILIDGSDLLQYDGTGWSLAGSGAWIDVALLDAAPSSDGAQHTVPLSLLTASAANAPTISGGSIVIPTNQTGRWVITCQARFDSTTPGVADLVIVVGSTNRLIGRTPSAAGTSVFCTKELSLNGGDVLLVQIVVGSTVHLNGTSGSGVESFITLRRVA